jgi:hypothetical protein
MMDHLIISGKFLKPAANAANSNGLISQEVFAVNAPASRTPVVCEFCARANPLFVFIQTNGVPLRQCNYLYDDEGNNLMVAAMGAGCPDFLSQAR